MYASASRRLPRKVRPCFVSTSRSIPTKCRSKGARIDSPDDDDDVLALFVVEEAVEVVAGFRVDSVAAAAADADDAIAIVFVLHHFNFGFGLCTIDISRQTPVLLPRWV